MKQKANEYLLFQRAVLEKVNIISQENYKTNWQVLLQQSTLVLQGIVSLKQGLRTALRKSRVELELSHLFLLNA